MTNNYFLHTKSLEVKSFEDYKTGMSKLIEIKYKCTPDEYIYRHDNVYYQAHYTSLCGAENSEAITAIMQYIEQCKPYKVDITSDTVFEHEFPSYNVGFMGIDFSSIEDIKKERQISDIISYQECKYLYHKNSLERNHKIEVPYHLACLFPDYEFEKDAIDDIIYWKDYNSYFITPILDLLLDVKEHPFTGGKGKTEVLTKQAGVASKRINDEHRLRYSLKDGKIKIFRCRGHY